jgi:hypothetical protein
MTAPKTVGVLSARAKKYRARSSRHSYAYGIGTQVPRSTSRGLHTAPVSCRSAPGPRGQNSTFYNDFFISKVILSVRRDNYITDKIQFNAIKG